jgi:hypothetical protein
MESTQAIQQVLQDSSSLSAADIIDVITHEKAPNLNQLYAMEVCDRIKSD